MSAHAEKDSKEGGGVGGRAETAREGGNHDTAMQRTSSKTWCAEHNTQREKRVSEQHGPGTTFFKQANKQTSGLSSKKKRTAAVITHVKREVPCPLALLSCRDVFGVEDHDIFRGTSSAPPLLLAAPVLRIDADGSGEVVRATLAGDVADESVGAIVVLRCFFPNTRFWTIESTMAALPL